MKVTHLQSATQIIDLDGIKVLTDPWLTDGEYYGSWYHYPPFTSEEISILNYDYIYVSHIHPDHLSEKTFKSLPFKKPVIIHNYDAKFVKRKLELLGFDVIECDHAVPYEFDNGGSITIYAADNCNPELCGKFMGCGSVENKFGSTQIDTFAVFKMGNCTLLNTNDCPFELAYHTIKDNNVDEMQIDLLLVGYAGAGPYPQCFEFDTDEMKKVAADAKEKNFLQNASKFIELVNPTSFAPFAGTYILGSRLAALNDYRGVPSVSDATKFLDDTIVSSNGVHLEKLDTFDCQSQTLSKSGTKFPLDKAEYTEKVSRYSLQYDNDQWEEEDLPRLMELAYTRFKSKADQINFQSDTVILIRSDRVAFKLSTNHFVEMVPRNFELLGPHVRIDLDHNLLHRLLRGPRYAHWNNAEIGSHLSYMRKPNIYERGLYHCMCFLHA